MITDMLGVDYWIIPCKTTDTTSAFALGLFDRWYYKHGLPDKIYSNQDKFFMSQFWRALTHIISVKLKCQQLIIQKWTGPVSGPMRWLINPSGTTSPVIN